MKRKLIFLTFGTIAIMITFLLFIGNPLIFLNNRALKKSILSIDSDIVTLNEIVPFED